MSKPTIATALALLVGIAQAQAQSATITTTENALLCPQKDTLIELQRIAQKGASVERFLTHALDSNCLSLPPQSQVRITQEDGWLICVDVLKSGQQIIDD